MKRLIAMLAVAAAAAVGPVAPASADAVSGTTTRAICSYNNSNPDIYYLAYWQTVHYGSAHVTQCEYRWIGHDPYTICKQYVWNIPSPYWSGYNPDYSSPAPYCW